MNILPKKKWHVRTKENMARVRRDEAKAAAEEAARVERATLAEHEDRVRRLKSHAANNYGPSMFDRPATSGNNSTLIDGVPTHVNLFEELETQERQNLQQGNKEYEAEKKKEYNDWESKMGIMKRFAEDTKEYSKDKYWWECIPLVRKDITDGFINNFAKNIIPNDLQQKMVKSTDGEMRKVAPVMKRRICEHVGVDTSLLPKVEKKRKSSEIAVIDPERLKVLKKKARKKLRKEQHEEKKKQKKERRKMRVQKRKSKGKERSSSPSSSSSADILEEKKSKTVKGQQSSVYESDVGQSDSLLSQLRAERIKREKEEKERAKALFQPKKEPVAKATFDLESDRTRKYNTQFNPAFAKQ